MADMHSLFAEMKEKNAPDLHIIAGSPILFRVDGRLLPVEGKKVTSEESRLLIHCWRSPKI